MLSVHRVNARQFKTKTTHFQFQLIVETFLLSFNQNRLGNVFFFFRQQLRFTVAYRWKSNSPLYLVGIFSSRSLTPTYGFSFFAFINRLLISIISPRNRPDVSMFRFRPGPVIVTVELTHTSRSPQTLRVKKYNKTSGHLPIR